MGTIDISYTSLAIGLLLLLIPLFYLWKFKTGLLWVTVIGIARMIVQLFFIGIYLKYLFLWNNPWINFLWVIIMIFVAAQTALARTQLKRKILFIPISIGFFMQCCLHKKPMEIGMNSIFRFSWVRARAVCAATNIIIITHRKLIHGLFQRNKYFR